MKQNINECLSQDKSCYIIGVDGGGSKTHAVLFDENNQIIDESFAGSANIRNDLNIAYNSICTAIDNLIEKHAQGTSSIKIGIGVAGYSVVSARESLYSRLCAKYQGMVSIIKLTSDAHIACLAAHKGQDGGVIICGTGVVAYIVCSGQIKQFGGWGFPHGDLGGAAYLGLELCKLLCKAIDQVIPWSECLSNIYQEKFNSNAVVYKEWLLLAAPNQFAQIARLMLPYIGHDDNVQSIYNAAIDEISKFICAVLLQSEGITKLDEGIDNNNGMKEINLSIAGGLAKFYYPALVDKFPPLSLCKAAPAVGAAYLVGYFH